MQLEACWWFLGKGWSDISLGWPVACIHHLLMLSEDVVAGLTNVKKIQNFETVIYLKSELVHTMLEKKNGVKSR